MRLHTLLATGIGALVSFASAATYVDPETGFTFNHITAQTFLSSSLTIRIAIPSTASPGSAYGAVIQVVAPLSTGWVGVTWAGRMLYNPLTVAWDNGQTPVVSSRWANSYAVPETYSGAQYRVFRTGTRVNGTHFQYTALCTGCTQFEGTTLNPSGTNNLAFALSDSPPSNPGDAASSLSVHSVTGYFASNFNEGRNANFDQLVQRNL